MEKIMDYKAPCEHTKNFNRIFALLIFLLSELATIIVTVVIGIGVSKEIIDMPSMRFLAFFAVLTLGPAKITSIVFFIISMVKGESLISASIYSLLFSKVFVYAVASNITMNMFLINIDLIILGIILILYILLEYIYYNKEKGVLLIVLQIIKIIFSIALMMMLPRLIKKLDLASEEEFAALVVSFFIGVLFVLLEGLYLTSINRRIPKSGIVSSLFVFVFGLAFSIFSIFMIDRQASKGNDYYYFTYKEPSILQRQTIFYVFIVLVIIYFLYSIALCVITIVKLNKLKEQAKENKKIEVISEVKEEIV